MRSQVGHQFFTFAQGYRIESRYGPQQAIRIERREMTTRHQVAAITKLAAAPGQGGKFCRAIREHHGETGERSAGIGKLARSRLRFQFGIKGDLSDGVTVSFQAAANISQGQVFFTFGSNQGNFHRRLVVRREPQRKSSNRYFGHLRVYNAQFY
jgi:hypothetical protein